MVNRPTIEGQGRPPSAQANRGRLGAYRQLVIKPGLKFKSFSRSRESLLSEPRVAHFSGTQAAQN